jgi:hypothetical protein
MNRNDNEFLSRIEIAKEREKNREKEREKNREKEKKRKKRENVPFSGTNNKIYFSLSIFSSMTVSI